MSSSSTKRTYTPAQREASKQRAKKQRTSDKALLVHYKARLLAAEARALAAEAELESLRSLMKCVDPDPLAPLSSPPLSSHPLSHDLDTMNLLALLADATPTL